MCNGKPDCPNGADEGVGCDYAECDHQEGLCSNGCKETPGVSLTNTFVSMFVIVRFCFMKNIILIIY